MSAQNQFVAEQNLLSDPKNPSPWRLLITTVAGIFIAEIIAMLVIFYLPVKQYWLATLLDALIMIVLVFPLVYFFSFRQILRQMSERQRSEALLANVLETLPVGVWIIDQAGRIIHGNTASRELWAGCLYVGIEQYHEYMAWWPDSGKRVEAEEWAATKALRTGSSCLNQELEIECFDGERRNILNSAVPFYTNHVLQGIIVVQQDITPLTLTMKALQQSNKEEHRQRELYESLVQSTLAVNTSLDLEQVLNTILEQVWRAIPFQAGNIVLVEENSLRVVRYLGLNGYPDQLTAMEKALLVEDFPLFSKISSMKQPILVADAGEYPDWRIVLGMERPGSFIAAPLVVEGKVIGVINLASDQQAAFTEAMLGRLMAFAASASVAVHNARLYKAEQYTRRVTETLNAASLALSQSLDLDTVVQTLIDYTCRLIPYDHAYFAIAESESRLTVRAVSGNGTGASSAAAQTTILNTSFDVWDIPNLHSLLVGRKPLLIQDTRQDPGWSSQIEDEGVRSWLGIPMVVNERVIGVLSMASSRPHLFTQEHMRLAEGIIVQGSIAVQNAWLFEQVRAGHERLQSLSRRLVEVQESERRYVARELHDETSQALTALMFGLRILEQDFNKPEKVLSRVIELKKLTDAVLEELHHLAMDLRPASLDHLGLVAALEQLTKSVAERYNLKVRYKSIGIAEKERLPDYIETTLYRIVQEALTNTVRHAHAQNVDVILESLDGKVMVLVEDDGAGFDTELIGKSGHLGLLGMQERAEMLGGVLQVESLSQGGTTIVAEIPYANSNTHR